MNPVLCGRSHLQKPSQPGPLIKYWLNSTSFHKGQASSDLPKVTQLLRVKSSESTTATPTSNPSYGQRNQEAVTSFCPRPYTTGSVHEACPFPSRRGTGNDCQWTLHDSRIPGADAGSLTSHPQQIFHCSKEQLLSDHYKCIAWHSEATEVLL